jgi:dihydrodipicolinate synthase/N-acetylneuraminate lyase
MPDAVEALAGHPNIAGMKESGADIGQIADYVARTPDDFTLLAGSADGIAVLADRIEGLISQEHAKWVSSRKESDATKPASG